MKKKETVAQIETMINAGLNPRIQEDGSIVADFPLNVKLIKYCTTEQLKTLALLITVELKRRKVTPELT